MSLSCFVWYRVAPEAREEVERVAAAMQARLERESGIRGRLLRRADDTATWMEIYEGIADGATFEATLGRLARDCGVEGLLDAGETRHVERFLPCA